MSKIKQTSFILEGCYVDYYFGDSVCYNIPRCILLSYCLWMPALPLTVYWWYNQSSPPPLSFSCFSKLWTMSVTSWRNMKRTITTRIVLRSTTGTSPWRGTASPKPDQTPTRVRRPFFSCQGLQATCKAKCQQALYIR